MANVRKWIRILHRDIGYIATGLTVIYAVSGVAVNHVDEWNPNYSIEKVTTYINPMTDTVFDAARTTEYVLKQIGVDNKVKNSFRPDPETLQIFTEGNNISVDLRSWAVTEERVKSRTGIRETNFLHLNAPKKIWTYVADLFAVALAFLAVSGLFMIKGKNGIKGRGAWLTIIGILIPVFFLLLYFY